MRAELRRALADEYRQVEALINLRHLIPFSTPMPPTRGWAASPDLLLYLVTLVRDRSPQGIVELGSGATTVWLAHAVRHFGIDSCHIVAIDHDADYAAWTAAELARHGLGGHAGVRHAPLREIDLDGQRWRWYDLAAISDIAACDLLIVDGPPGPLQPLARYPALPALIDKLGEDATVVLDDYRRPDEREIVQRWLRGQPGWIAQEIDHEKGTAVLSRSR